MLPLEQYGLSPVHDKVQSALQRDFSVRVYE